MNILPSNTKLSCGLPKNFQPTILLVEDDPAVREVTRAVLEYSGYKVLESDGPEEALRLGSEHRGCIELLLSDVVMPGMNGPDLALRLQSLQPGLITVFMSGYADHEELHQARPDGMTAYIQKPFTIEVLLSCVARALRAHPSVREAARLSDLSG